MYDLYVKMKTKLSPKTEIDRYSLGSDKYIIAAITGTSLADNKDNLQSILSGLNIASRDFGLKVIFALHPRT